MALVFDEVVGTVDSELNAPRPEQPAQAQRPQPMDAIDSQLRRLRRREERLRAD